jgi:2-oxoglutarate dehydrogenase E2 component (dihydrolipoamide succinyltransferase)
MAEEALLLPKMGESIEEATIIRWLKNEGDPVEVDEPVVEIATDKVDSEVPSTVAGIMGKPLCGEGDVVKVGSPIVHIHTEGATASTPAPEPVKQETVEKVEARVETAKDTVAAPVAKPADQRFYSPLVMNIARTEGVSMSELEQIPGTGSDGRVTKRDILSYLKNGRPSTTSVTAQSAPEAPAVTAPKPEIKPAAPLSAGDEVIAMDRMRKLIAEHMVKSKQTSPHVTSFVEADVTNMVNWRNKNKGEFLKREGEKLTFTPLFIEAVVKAIKDFPLINITVDGDNIIRKKTSI